MESIKGKNMNLDYRLIDLLKFVCAFLVIGIHTRPFQASSDLLDQFFYYDIANYAVPFFYACRRCCQIQGNFRYVVNRYQDITRIFD